MGFNSGFKGLMGAFKGAEFESSRPWNQRLCVQKEWKCLLGPLLSSNNVM